VLALSGFIIALLAGMNAENPTSSVIVTGLVCMVVCHIVGTMLGLVIEKVLNEHRLSLATSETAESPVQMGIEIGEEIEIPEPASEAQEAQAKAAA